MICKPRCRILGFSWSSSENSSTNAWNVNLNNGNVNTNTKSNINDNNRVRSFLSSKLAQCSNYNDNTRRHLLCLLLLQKEQS